MAPLAELGQRHRQAVCRLAVATGEAYAYLAWLFGAVGPAQPDQAVLAKAGVTVQGPSSAEGAAVADTCPVATVQSAQRSDRERALAGADTTRNRVWRWLLGRSRKAGLEGPIRCGSGIDVSSEDLGYEDDQRAADWEQQLIEAFC